MDMGKHYIKHWMISTPYTKAGKNAQALFSEVLPPEQKGAKVKWTKLRPQGWAVDFNRISGLPGHNRCIYVKADIYSAAKQDVMLKMGSDDGIKVWINGTVVHANNALRGHAYGQDSKKATLQKGWQVLLVKVTQSTGGWAVSVGITPLPGKKLAEIKKAAQRK